MVDATGLRISQRTLRALKDLPQLFDPQEFDPDADAMMSDISVDEARALYRIFRYFNAGQAKNNTSRSPQKTRQRFEKHFKVEFS